ncbi:hypothetical protein HFO55_03215 [Rhizobium leguminosarum]|uniref:hypothetical protein n=1 Tax=Rhizobium leguminosarum TaxID=384 RepID=UPI001C96CC6E|nr:hypothetical protein [Rhizobium leguminosarum]MBY5566271.1 hypothetical protein [Rhizobium leguminosarum]MBY5573549.1 hypothetical protein [Rhizobium leguminosarum]
MMRPALMILTIVTAAALLAALQATTPPYAILTGPIRTTGHQTETVLSRTFGVKVLRVLKARTIAYTRFGRPVELQSSGVWVVVAAELRAFQETMPVRAATLIGASGRLYRQSRRAGEAPDIVSAKVVQPGLPTSGIFVFELPEDETRSMKLVLSEQYGPQLRDEVSVLLEADATAPRSRLEIGKDGV